MSNNHDVMSRWMQESLTALQDLRSERNQHEQSLEAAMEAIRMHTQAIERIEHDIEVIENAVAGASDPPAHPPRQAAPSPPVALEDDYETTAPTEIRHISQVAPPTPPPLRPVSTPRLVGQH